jgi:uncharacterized protein (DUF1501 family)
MDRRDFLKMVGTVVPAWSLIPITSNAQSMYNGRILINVHAGGGLDASSFFDPRETDPLMNFYAQAGTPAGVAGRLRVAPMANNIPFAQANFSRMLVINGVHSETNSHDDGTRAHATGRLDLGYPNLSELFAAKYGQNAPLAWLNAGGFDDSAGLVAPTPVPDVNTFRALVTPNQATATTDFIKQSDMDKMFAARSQRMAALRATGLELPKQAQVTDQFLAANDSRAFMERVASFIPATFDAGFGTANVALIAAQAGITQTIQLSSGGFDGHSNIVNSYNNSLPRLTNLVQYLLDKSAALGLSDRVFIRVYSEFSRTPLINNGAGKDHYANGSQVWIEGASTWAAGNRVFGASGPRHEALRINPATGAVDPVNGVIMRPRHLHAVLRNYLGIQTTNPKFDLRVPANEMFDILNPANHTGYLSM